MSKPSLLTVRTAPVYVASLLAFALACSSSEDSMPIGTGTGGTGTGSGGSSTAGTGTTPMAGTGTTPTAGTGTTPTAGSGSIAGSSSGGSASGGSSSGGSASGGSSSGGSASGGSGHGGSGGGSSGGSGGGSSGSGGGSATGCTAALKVCDDFEGDAPGKGASAFKTTGTVEVVTDVHHSGMKSVHISAPNGNSTNININTSKPFPTTDMWGRAWVQIKATGTEHQMYIGINFNAGTKSDQDRLLNRLGSDTPQVNFQQGDKFYAAGVKFTQGMWFCYEWHVTDSATSIYIDGKKQMLSGGTNGDAPGAKGGTQLLLGFQRFVSGSGTADVWYDDVAVGDAQIGCQ